MLVHVGSSNPAKIETVRRVLLRYKKFAAAEVIGVGVPSGVADQPLSLEEMFEGAWNRANAAFDMMPRKVYLAIGLESGLFDASHRFVKFGKLDATACIAYDGETIGPGLSMAFECPDKVMHGVLRGGMNLSDAFLSSGLTSDPLLGQREGAIGIMTDGNISRSAYMEAAVHGALMRINHPEWFL